MCEPSSNPNISKVVTTQSILEADSWYVSLTSSAFFDFKGGFVRRVGLDDLNQVGRDQITKVGRDSRSEVGGDFRSVIGGQTDITHGKSVAYHVLDGNWTSEVNGDISSTSTGSKYEKVDQNYTIETPKITLIGSLDVSGIVTSSPTSGSAKYYTTQQASTIAGNWTPLELQIPELVGTDTGIGIGLASSLIVQQDGNYVVQASVSFFLSTPTASSAIRVVRVLDENVVWTSATVYGTGLAYFSTCAHLEAGEYRLEYITSQAEIFGIGGPDPYSGSVLGSFEIRTI